MTPYKTRVFLKRPEDFQPVVEVAGCYCICDGKYLFLKRSAGKPQGNTWGVPGGKLEQGESSLEAVIREVLEESAIQLDREGLLEVGPLFIRHPHIDFIYYMFRQEFAEEPFVDLSDEHQEYRWVTFEEAHELPLISGGSEALVHFCDLVKGL